MCFSESWIVLAGLINVLTTNSDWLWMVPCLHVAALVFRKWSNKSFSVGEKVWCPHLHLWIAWCHFGVITSEQGQRHCQAYFGKACSAIMVLRAVLEPWQSDRQRCQGAWEKNFLQCKWFIWCANFSVPSVHHGANDLQESSRGLLFKSIFVFFEARCHENTECY